MDIRLHDQAVRLHFPLRLEREIRELFIEERSPTFSPQSSINIVELSVDRFSLRGNSGQSLEFSSFGELTVNLLGEVARVVIEDMKAAVALHAGAVAYKDKAVLIAGASGSGKSSLIAFLLAHDFHYLTDEVAVLIGDSAVAGLPRALILKPGATPNVAALPIFAQATLRKYSGFTVLPPPVDSITDARECGLIILPQFQAGESLSIEIVSPGKTTLKLLECNLNARNLRHGGVKELSSLARKIPTIRVTYSDISQLENVIDVLAKLVIDQSLPLSSLSKFAAGFATPVRPLPRKIFSIPKPTPRNDSTYKLTIGMATYDDYDGVYFSLQALRLYHHLDDSEIELLVIDNHPDGPCSAALKSLEKDIPNFRYIPNNTVTGTAVRDYIFKEARGEFVLCMDSHVLFAEGAIGKLISYFETNSQSSDLLQGPLLYDDLENISTHFEVGWREGMYGTWACDDRGKVPDQEPFDIPMQGLGVFACRRDAWPGLNRHFRGFGGEEGYIHEKFRRRGGRVLCLPFLKWVHRFNRPQGVPYRNTWDDRIRNYMIGWEELDLNTHEVRDHFSGFLGTDKVESILRSVECQVAADQLLTPTRKVT